MRSIIERINDLKYRYGVTLQSMVLRIKERKCSFEDQVSIVCIARYEAQYIKEWVDYHLLIGVDRIYVYDNDSPDGMREVLDPYIKTGKVVYTLFPGVAQHLPAYNDAIQRFRYRTKYMAFIDVDEFIVLENEEDRLFDVLDSIMKKNWRSGGVAVNWRMYGSSNHKNKPEGLVSENYLCRGDEQSKGSDCIKTIANPRFIRQYRHSHSPVYITGFNNVNEDGKIVIGWSNENHIIKRIRINHYFTKSYDEWIERRSRRKSDSNDKDDLRTVAEFYEHDHNDVYDTIMLRYVNQLKK